MKLTKISAVLFSQFVAAEAGSQEAQHDARLCATYTAYFNALRHGNKTQLQLVQAACAQYDSPKACRALTATPDRASAAASHAAKVYAAYKLALDTCGIPALMKGAPVETVEAAAEELAFRFVDVITVAITPEAKPVKDKAEIKAEREKATKQAEKERKAEIRAAAQAIADANALTLADMVAAVVNAMRTGALSADQLQQIDSALDAAAVTVETVTVPLSPQVAESLAA